MGLFTSSINENREEILATGNLSRVRTRLATPLLVFLISILILGAFTTIWGPSQKFHRHDDPEDYMALGQALHPETVIRILLGSGPTLPNILECQVGLPSFRLASGWPPERRRKQ